MLCVLPQLKKKKDNYSYTEIQYKKEDWTFSF